MISFSEDLSPLSQQVTQKKKLYEAADLYRHAGLVNDAKGALKVESAGWFLPTKLKYNGTPNEKALYKM